MEKNDELKEKEEEDNSCCTCCSTKCQIIAVSVFVIIDFFGEVIRIVIVGLNKYFDPIYLWVYVALGVALLVSVVLVCYYLFARDSKESRAIVPWAFLISAVACFLIVCWIIYYIFFMYEKNDVYVASYDGGSNMNRRRSDDEDYDKA